MHANFYSSNIYTHIFKMENDNKEERNKKE